MRLAGSEKCEECRGRGEVCLGERHGEAAWDDCPCCKGRGTRPVFSLPENFDAICEVNDNED